MLKSAVQYHANIHLDVLQLEVFGHWVVLTDSEDIGDDVMRGIPPIPKGLKNLIGLLNVPLNTVTQHLLD